ncbi:MULTISPECIES: hypothetical protein [Ornithinibacillus]|uniref:DUF4083 domain-containing protein n=2 Tax=Ornithinibacillus TaxID=484508 RepID=A0A923L705_9BACI|nr:MULTISPECIES: hypothetical protein [Ornithinibacillus]MBC5637636.1 hypothetical protein [Ornithinibacillus hominis]MBS3681688.1 hypothetical protein [Ornithinibacillus massiliensis]
MEMVEAIGIFGGFLSLIFALIPIALAVFVLIWLYQMKVNSDVQVKQNQEIIRLLEEVRNK